LALGRKQTLDRAPTDVAATLDGVERMVTRLAGAKVRVVRHVARDVGYVLADRGQIEQVLLNLAINACDAMPDGGTLTMSAGAVLLDEGAAADLGLAAGAFVRVSVEDSGVGMSDATRASIFEPFFTTKPVGKGTGLGLAIAHGIVTQHNGSITVDSVLGRGATFTVLLPQAPAIAAAVEAQSSQPPRASSELQTILVVEDEPGVRRALGRTLGGLGYRVILASDGNDALRIAEDLGGIDLLLSDVIMPGLDGPEVASRLRGRWPSLRVLFVSGYSDDRLAQAGALGPRDRLLAKPYSAKALATAVRDVIASAAS
jgi:CheY-like chemotaxis protein